MHVFVYEYTCSGAMAGAHTSLRTEGWAMLAAALADFARVPGVEVVTILDEQCPPGPQVQFVRRVRSGEEEHAFRRAARSADFTLVVAPEFDDLLATRCRWAEEEGSRLLGPTVEAVQLTADKLALAGCLRAAGVRTPETWPYFAGQSLPPIPFPAVCKPRHGAGSGATYLIHGPEHLTQVPAVEWPDEFLLQPFLPGQPVSVAFLLGPGEQLTLPPAAQALSEDGRFQYRGGRLPLSPPLAERASRLAWQAVRTVAGLRGYVGVDLVLGGAGDGSQDSVMEINPRLTTSYVGLRALAETNLAETMLCLVNGRTAPLLKWRTGSVQFQSDGTVSLVTNAVANKPLTTDH